MKKITEKIIWMLMGIFLTTGSAYAGRFALVADYGNQRVAEFYVSGTTWTYVKDFVNTSTSLGSLAPLNHPEGVVQDQQGLIYVSDQGTSGANRILRFDTNGAFVDMVGTNGLNGFNVPGSGIDDMVCGPDGNIYGTLAFGTGNNQILKFNVANTNWSVLYANATLSTPRGLDFGPDGNLYVNNRGNARMLVISTNGVLLRTNATFSGTVSTAPMGNRWDPVGNRFICSSGNGNSLICSCTTNGTLALITGVNPTGGPGANKSILGVLADSTNVFYVPYNNPGHIFLCNNSSSSSVSVVDTGTTPVMNVPAFMNFVTGLSIGTLQSVTLNVTRTNMLQGTFEQAQLLGNYAYQNNVNITSDAGTSLSSSDPGVVTITANGLVSAIGVGSATITASNGGQTSTVVITVVPLVTTIIHRYGFTTDASDSVGTANGVVWYLNPDDFSFANGEINFMPSGPTDYNYIDFGPNTISSNDVVTFEAWATFGTNYTWFRLFDFGNNNGTSGTSYIALTPHSSVNTTRLALLTSGGTEVDLDAPGVLDNQTNVHIVAVIHPLAGYMKLYINGVLAAQKLNVSGQDLADLVNNYSYLGKSQFSADPAANMSVDEFRIYSGVLDATNVAIDYAAGPNNIVSDPGAVQSISLVINTNMLQQGNQTVVAYGNFSTVTNVPLNSFPGVTFASDNTNVLTISSTGLIQAVGFGTANITVTYGGQSVSYLLMAAALPQARVLAVDEGNNRILLYNVVGTNWVLNSVFASGVYGGLPLTSPTGVAQDASGNVYVCEATATGRLLKFNSAGNYLGTLGTAGVDFLGTPGYLAVDPNGNVYMTTPFGTNNILEYNVASSAWSIFVPTTGDSYTLSNPMGIAFDPSGNLYVCNRGSFNAANRSVLEFDVNGVYVPNPNTAGDFATGLVGPQGLTWDAANNRFLVVVSASQIAAIATNGVVTALSGLVGSDMESALSIGQGLFYTDYSLSGVYTVSGYSSSALVAGGMSHAQQMVLAVLPPNINISLNGTNILVSWPYSLAGYNLLSSTSLGSANWQPVQSAPVLVGNTMQVSMPQSNNAMFFRLSN